MEKIKTKNYILIIDDSEMSVGDWCLDITTNTIFKCNNIKSNVFDFYKKIIGYRPLGESKKLDNVDLLNLI